MRLNQYIARASGLSRRQADELIAAGKVSLNSQQAGLGNNVSERDIVAVNGEEVKLQPFTYILLNKPVGYVCSRRQQGSAPTIYDLVPEKYHHLKPVGRLDKDSSGILLLTNDGELAQQLTHPKYQKTKIYEVTLNKKLSDQELVQLNRGVKLPDGISHLGVKPKGDKYQITMQEGRNRQIRRTFASLGYEITSLHRTVFGPLTLAQLGNDAYSELSSSVFV